MMTFLIHINQSVIRPQASLSSVHCGIFIALTYRSSLETLFQLCSETGLSLPIINCLPITLKKKKPCLFSLAYSYQVLLILWLSEKVNVIECTCNVCSFLYHLSNCRYRGTSIQQNLTKKTIQKLWPHIQTGFPCLLVTVFFFSPG